MFVSVIEIMLRRPDKGGAVTASREASPASRVGLFSKASCVTRLARPAAQSRLCLCRLPGIKRRGRGKGGRRAGAATSISVKIIVGASMLADRYSNVIILSSAEIGGLMETIY